MTGCERPRNIAGELRPARRRERPFCPPGLRVRALPWHGTRRNRSRPMAFKQRVFSGVQPTGNLHLGNYLGAIKRFVELQQSYDCIYCVVDMHAITVPVSVWGGPAELRRATREVTAAYIACGIDPKQHIVFNQRSEEHTSELQSRGLISYAFFCLKKKKKKNRQKRNKKTSASASADATNSHR